MLDVDLLAFRFNNILDRFISRFRDPLAKAVYFLLAPWDHALLILTAFLLKFKS